MLRLDSTPLSPPAQNDMDDGANTRIMAIPAWETLEAAANEMPEVVPATSAGSLFSALVASVPADARLQARLGAAEAARAVERCLKRMERVVDAFGGQRAPSVAGRLTTVFPAADDALYAAIEMRQRIAELPPISGIKMSARFGLSTGSDVGLAGSIGGMTVNEAAHLAVQARPGQILIFANVYRGLTTAAREALRDHAQTLDEGFAKDEFSGMTVLEILSPSTKETLKPAEKESVERRVVFRLRYAGREFLLSDTQVLWIGRHDDSDLVLQDRRASRHHARLERRGESVFLVDRSTNGSFISAEGHAEAFLHNAKCILSGKGRIYFAASSRNGGIDYVDFELS